eukprot:gene25889-32396_t
MKAVRAVKSSETSSSSPSLDFNGLSMIAHHCTELTKLTLQNSFLFLEDSSIPMSSAFSALTFLDLSSNKTTQGSQLAALTAACPALEVLDLSCCEMLKDCDVDVITAACPRLVDVDLSYAALLTDASIVFLVTRCPGLKRLSGGYTKLFTDVGVEAIAEHCKGIESLKITSSENVTDASLLRVLNCCYALQELSVWGCKVSDAVVNAIRDSRGDELVAFHYSIGRPSLVTREAAKALRTVRPALIVLSEPCLRIHVVWQ